jgi:polyisoprenyl-teichoic acid--peptidoglycan teichoic acid transferase
VTRRFMAVLLVLAAWIGGTVVGSLGTPRAAASDPAILIGAAHADYTPTLTGSKPIVILAVGSGARPGDDVMHSLSDSLHLIFLNPDGHAAAMVGIPRDSWVDIPGHGTDKINNALVFGGPDLMVQTIEGDFGVHIDYWALTTFWGFKAMIDQIGGLHVDVPFRMYDTYSGADLHAGAQTLTGAQALSFARDRHSMLQGDFTRQENGGRLILAALAQFQKAYAKDPTALLTWIGAGMSNFGDPAAKFIGTNLSADQIVQLAYTVTAQPVKKVQNIVFPGSAQMQGSKSVVVLDDTAVHAIIADASDDATVAKKNVPPSPGRDQPVS